MFNKCRLINSRIKSIYLFLYPLLVSCTGYQSQNLLNHSILPNNNLKAEDFYDTGAKNSLSQADHLFEFVSITGDSSALMTSSTETNIHSHLVAGYQFDSFTLSGRLMHTSANAGIGVTFLSQYPAQDAYYRIRRYHSKKYFHLEGHSNTQCNGKSVDFESQAGVWYGFRITTDVSESSTQFKIELWPVGNESQISSIDCEDSSSYRFRAGTVGVWSMGSGDKYWANMKMEFNLFSNGSGGTSKDPLPTPAPTPDPDPTPTPYPIPSSDFTIYPRVRTEVGATTKSCPNYPTKTIGSISLKNDGEILENVRVNGSIAVKAANVKIRCVTTSGGLYALLCKESDGCKNLLVENSEFLNANSSGMYFQGQTNATVRSSVYGRAPDGLKVNASGNTFEHNFLECLRASSSGHMDGLQSRSGNDNIYRFNNFSAKSCADSENQGGGSGSFFIEAGNFNRTLVQGNFFSGAGYTLRISGAINQNFTFIDNVIERNSYTFGPLNYRSSSALCAQWSNNRFHDNGALLGNSAADDNSCELPVR